MLRSLSRCSALIKLYPYALRLVSGLLLLVMASEADADALFPGQKFAAGDWPRSVAVADFDGDTVPRPRHCQLIAAATT